MTRPRDPWRFVGGKWVHAGDNPEEHESVAETMRRCAEADRQRAEQENFLNGQNGPPRVNWRDRYFFGNRRGK